MSCYVFIFTLTAPVLILFNRPFNYDEACQCATFNDFRFDEETEDTHASLPAV